MDNVLSGRPAAGSPPNGGADDFVRDTTTKTFVRDVIEESKRQPVLVDFWAPWCGPCRTLSPIIEKVVRAAKGAVKLVKMNIDDHPAVAGQLGVQSIPAVFAFVNGQPVDGFVGALPESQIKTFIDRLAKSNGGKPDIDAVVAEGDALLAEGDFASAAELFADILAADPADLRGIGGLARAAIAAGDLERAKRALGMVPAAKANDPALAAARAQLALAEQTASLGDLNALRARVAANPTDHQARFDLALAANASGQREEAADLLLEIVKRSRVWEDEKARKQLVQFFDAWGPTDPATLASRRRLSSILFS